MRTAPAGGALAVVVLVLAGCGAATTSKPEPPALPPPAPVAPEMTASGTDAKGDSPDRTADLVSASLRQEAGHLIVRMTLARPVRPRRTRVDIGAYLLRNEDDDQPAALHVVVGRTGAPQFRLGPFLGKGKPVKGTIDGATVEIDAGAVEQGRWRFVQFYTETDAGGDVLPDVSAKADDKLAIAGAAATTAASSTG